jgi:flagellar basal body-associated protein FliL
MEKKKMVEDESHEARENGQNELGGEESTGAKKMYRSPLFLAIALGSLVVVCLLAGAAALYVKSRKASTKIPKPTVKYITTITRPVPLLKEREMLDFLITYQVQGREVVTALRMEAGFHSFAKHKKFQAQAVIFRQAVYNFLLTQNAANNSLKSWDSVFAKNLLDYLRGNLPQICPDTIRLTQLENL